jgi:HSP20 family protein
VFSSAGAWGKKNIFKIFDFLHSLPFICQRQAQVGRQNLTSRKAIGLAKEHQEMKVMSIVRWNPWREFDDFFPRLAPPSESLAGSEWLPAVDISETDTAYHIDLEIPAIARDDVNVAVKDGVLTVTGERKVEKQTDGKTHRVERQYGKFARSFRLPENVDDGSISAKAKDGVLYVVVSKKEQEQPRQIEVKVH